jgi:hypothetical protein
MKRLTFITVVLTSSFLCACGSTTGSRAGSGAAMGAAGGALIGSMSANAGQGALIGAGAEDAAEAAAWYERQREGLGIEFLRAVDAALDLLEDDLVPLTPVPVSASKRGAKRLVLNRFPTP